jgi:membrane carboxypeptidase/penicillin-binding protein PbpC
MVDGRVWSTGERRREFEVEGLERGFLSLSVIDATGRAARAKVQLD